MLAPLRTKLLALTALDASALSPDVGVERDRTSTVSVGAPTPSQSSNGFGRTPSQLHGSLLSDRASWLPESELKMCAGEILKNYQRMVSNAPTGMQADWLADPPSKKNKGSKPESKTKKQSTSGKSRS